MMPVRFQLMSDLHLEFLDNPEDVINKLDPSGVDCLLLAGDICSPTMLESVARWTTALYPRVLMVFGNHDYFYSSPDAIHGNAARVQGLFPNFQILRDDLVDVGGAKVAGCTLWYPQSSDPRTHLDRKCMPEFSVVKGFEPWVYEQHTQDVKFLRQNAHRADIVMTHHLPHPSLISKRFQSSSLNHYFMVDLSELIEESGPKVWAHGHTHDAKDMVVGQTRLLCNPKGYPNERYTQPWNKKLVIDIEPTEG